MARNWLPLEVASPHTLCRTRSMNAKKGFTLVAVAMALTVPTVRSLEFSASWEQAVSDDVAARRGWGAFVGGFTLVELMVALVILTVGVLGLASSTVWAVRQSTLSELAVERSTAVQAVVEQLRAADYTRLTAGQDSVGRFDVAWTVTPGSRSKLVTVVTVGPGLASHGAGMPALTAEVTDTFAYRIIAR